MKEQTTLQEMKCFGLKKLLEKQQHLDAFIINNSKIEESLKTRTALKFTALQVEVAEWANASRCFKYWSKKPAEPKERLIDEAADVMHFFLSICNDMGISAEELYEGYLKKNEENYRRQDNGY